MKGRRKACRREKRGAEIPTGATKKPAALKR